MILKLQKLLPSQKILSSLKMKVAVFYTGSVRTMQKTISYFVQNILEVKSIKPNIFAVIDATPSEKESTRKTLEQYLGQALISLQWFDHHNPHYKITKAWCVDNIMYPNWIDYLSNHSGSMIEHYQLLMAYRAMLKHEWQLQTRYDYIFRTRSDLILNTPLDFHWLNLDIKQIETRINKIKSNGYDNLKTFMIFMSTIYYKELFDQVKDYSLILRENFEANIDTYDYKLAKIIKTLDSEQIKWFLKDGRYILTIRCNLLYLCKRKDFNLVPLLGISYGLGYKFNNVYTFNSEGQFELFCKYSKLSIFDYDDQFDGSSLYQYEEGKFFDNKECKANLYCLVRK